MSCCLFIVSLLSACGAGTASQPSAAPPEATTPPPPQSHAQCAPNDPCSGLDDAPDASK